MEGKIKYFNNLTTMATLTLHIGLRAQYVPPTTATFWKRVATAWHRSTQTLGEFVQQIGIGFVIVLPWLVPIGMLVIVWRIVLRSLRKSLRQI